MSKKYNAYKNSKGISRNLILIIMFMLFTAGGLSYPSKASAIVVGRLDLRAEIQTLAMITDQINYFKNVLTNLDGLEGISQLKDLASGVKNMVAEIASVKDEITEAVSGAMGELSGIIDTEIGNVDLASVLNLPVEGVEGVQEEIKSVLTEELKAGEVKQVTAALTDRAKIMLEEKLGLEKKTQAVNTNKGTPLTELVKKKKAEEAAARAAMDNQGKGTEAVKEALTIAKDAVPLSFGSVQEAAAKIAVDAEISDVNQKLFALNTADQSRNGIISEISKILAPYAADVASEASYRHPLNKLQEQSAKALEKTTELSNGGPSEALRTIASLSAVMVEEIGIQNQMMVAMADIMADDIKMSGIVALTGVDSYAESVQQNIQKYIEVYNRIGTK